MRSSRVLQTPVVIAFIMRIIYARRLRSAHTDGFDDLVLDKVEKETWRQAKRAVKAKHHHKYHHGARRWHKTVPADEHEKEGGHERDSHHAVHRLLLKRAVRVTLPRVLPTGRCLTSLETLPSDGGRQCAAALHRLGLPVNLPRLPEYLHQNLCYVPLLPGRR